MTPNLEEQKRNLFLAYTASECSPDPSTRVGAVLIGSRKSWDDGWSTAGYNHFPNGVDDDLEQALLVDRDTKMKWIVHAERNAIFAAAREGFGVKESTMYCTWGPCAECAQAVVQSGIATFVRHKQSSDRCPERWAADLVVADEILRVGGVEIIEYDGPIGGVKGLVDGKEWSP